MTTYIPPNYHSNVLLNTLSQTKEQTRLEVGSFKCFDAVIDKLVVTNVHNGSINPGNTDIDTVYSTIPCTLTSTLWLPGTSYPCTLEAVRQGRMVVIKVPIIAYPIEAIPDADNTTLSITPNGGWPANLMPLGGGIFEYPLFYGSYSMHGSPSNTGGYISLNTFDSSSHLQCVFDMSSGIAPIIGDSVTVWNCYFKYLAIEQ